jgi:cytochrome c-type biogenesis protein CcmF
MALLSKETFLLANSVLLCTATLAVLLGTLYPLIIDALRLGKLSVGPPYFNVVFAPLMVPVLFMMVPGAMARWRQAKWSELKPLLVFPFLCAVIFALGLSLWMGHQDAGILLGFWLGAWVAFASLQQIILRAKQGLRMGGSFVGMQLAHVGLAVVVLGVTGVKNFEIERDVRMGVNDQVTLAQYHFKLIGVKEVRGPNYKALRAQVDVTQADSEAVIKTLTPEKRFYLSSAMPMTEASIDSGFMQDLYVSLGDVLSGETPQWSMRVYYKPFVPWLWAGVLLMVLGGLIATFDKRYRAAPTPTQDDHEPVHGASVHESTEFDMRTESSAQIHP